MLLELNNGCSFFMLLVLLFACTISIIISKGMHSVPRETEEDGETRATQYSRDLEKGKSKSLASVKETVLKVAQ